MTFLNSGKSAREWLVEKEDLNSSRFNIEKSFKELNKKVFKDELTLDFAIRWGKFKNRVGQVLFDRMGNQEVNIIEFMITDYYAMTKEQFEGIMLHEMIHVYIFQKGIRDNGDHGRHFQSMMQDINSKGYNISKTENAEDFKVSSKVTMKPLFALVIEWERAKFKNLLVYNSHNSKDEDEFIEVLQRHARSQNEGMTLHWVESTNPYFRKFKIARSLKTALNRQYELDEKFYDEIVKDTVRSNYISGKGDFKIL